MMLKFTLSFLLVLYFQIGYSQTNEGPVFFGQCKIELNSAEQANELAETLREIPYIKTVRVDWLTKRIILITKDLNEFSEASFKAWLGDFAPLVSCIQIGLHGIDAIQPYPFTNCND